MSKLGELVVYAGPMFAGKTSGLIAEIQMRIENNPGSKIKVYKPSIDNRYDLVDIKTHEGYSVKELTGIDVNAVSISHDFNEAFDADFVAIDEAQFFDKKLANVVSNLLNEGIDVVISGLELDSDANSFGAMFELIELATFVEQLFAVCVVCGEPADRTFRKTKLSGKVLIGSSDYYEPRCQKHWEEGMLNKQ